mmetsp:Transcript_41947/g.105795  ORF Transcript_41947/g.105795 Transcript_41947/m.105795 type:complete len:327 (-) Transcript_41947:40-1020(-)
MHRTAATAWRAMIRAIRVGSQRILLLVILAAGVSARMLSASARRRSRRRRRRLALRLMMVTAWRSLNLVRILFGALLAVGTLTSLRRASYRQGEGTNRLDVMFDVVLHFSTVGQLEQLVQELGRQLDALGGRCRLRINTTEASTVENLQKEARGRQQSLLAECTGRSRRGEHSEGGRTRLSGEAEARHAEHTAGVLAILTPQLTESIVEERSLLGQNPFAHAGHHLLEEAGGLIDIVAGGVALQRGQRTCNGATTAVLNGRDQLRGGGTRQTVHADGQCARRAQTILEPGQQAEHTELEAGRGALHKAVAGHLGQRGEESGGERRG